MLIPALRQRELQIMGGCHGQRACRRLIGIAGHIQRVRDLVMEVAVVELVVIARSVIVVGDA